MILNFGSTKYTASWKLNQFFVSKGKGLRAKRNNWVGSIKGMSLDSCLMQRTAIVLEAPALKQ